MSSISGRANGGHLYLKESGPTPPNGVDDLISSKEHSPFLPHVGSQQTVRESTFSPFFAESSEGLDDGFVAPGPSRDLSPAEKSAVTVRRLRVLTDWAKGVLLPSAPPPEVTVELGDSFVAPGLSCDLSPVEKSAVTVRRFLTDRAEGALLPETPPPEITASRVDFTDRTGFEEPRRKTLPPIGGEQQQLLQILRGGKKSS